MQRELDHLRRVKRRRRLILTVVTLSVLVSLTALYMRQCTPL
jgi:hypothetical protein